MTPMTSGSARIDAARALSAAALLATALVFAPAPTLAAAPKLATVSPQQAGFSAERLQRVDAAMEKWIAAGDIPGGVVLIARDGRIVHLKAYGRADIASGKPASTDSIYRIASMSKPVAALAILMLVEEGKVRLADPVSTFLPSYKNMKVAMPVPGAPAPAAGQPPQVFTVPAAREITVLDVLTHSSGLMSGAASNAGGQAAFGKRHEIGLAWVDNLGTDSALEFQPGTRWAYSPVAGLDVAARIVEKVSGKTFDAFLRERLFGPLGMDDTFFWPTAAQRARLVTSYLRTDGKLVPNANADSMSSPVYFSGGGGLMSSAESYARMAMMLANGGEWNGVRILSPAMVQLMGSAILPDSLPGRQPGEGFGLGVRSVSDRVARLTLIGNGSFGWSGAYGTHFWVDPANRLVGIVLSQVSGWGAPSPTSPTNDFETAVMQALVAP
jgi:CubicO group peptidase (beta-lactamase class C family)